MTRQGTLPESTLARGWRLYHASGLHQVVIVLICFGIYFAIRGLVVGRAGEAFANAYALVDFQKSVGLNHELEMQSWILGSYALIKGLNWIYFWGHMPLVILVAVWLFFRHRRAYFVARNAFLASGAIAIVIYWLWPVAPPRLLPFEGFIDTMAVYDRVGYNAQETQAFVNQYAAMPSLHYGWSLLLGVVIIRVVRRPYAWVAGIAWPVAMFFSVVLTANHYIIDTIAGSVVSLAGLGIAMLMERRNDQLLAPIRQHLPWLLHEG